MGASFGETFYRAMTAMVVASPCTLIISTPASILSAIGGAARRGVLFKGGAHLERTATVQVVAFDKTGTLTQGKPRVTDIVSDEASPGVDMLLQLAVSVEANPNTLLRMPSLKHGSAVSGFSRRPISNPLTAKAPRPQ